ncbi:MBL fold metallo-hydrolase [Halobacterium sp. R2-5]|uniref:MBL fold metallo-hydrolase n=1 Tax=Halobacterium sp. R2-5 TaxID=2715751 RepID=UPI0014209147|nr:MBL fold metallo-hydrolase [Halobacterium sp. R2-5]NIB98316.1 MBL fold metallo-hydrolase [Halobacterium sp. R2-5]
MDLRFLGGAREVGRSAVLVDDSLLLDYGMKPGTPPSYPADVDPDAVVVSHGHLDHAGAVPGLVAGGRRPPIHWTPPTRDLTRLLAEDTLKLQGGGERGGRHDCPFTRAEVAALGEVSETHGYGETFEAAGYEVTLYDAGHIPGSAHVLVDSAGRSPASNRTESDDDGDTRLLYTADFNTEDQRLLAGTTARPDADVVVTESTYADVTRDDRASIEDAFASSVAETVRGGGTAVVPAFAIGRTQELFMVCAAHDIPCYVDGMGVAVTERFKQTSEFLRDPEAFRAACGHARFLDASTRNGQRKRIAEKPTAIVTTAGMLSGGPAMTYVPEIAGNPQHELALTGYQVEGTPGRDLLDTGSAEIDGRHLRVAARVHSYDFSAHADREGLREFLDDYRGAEVLVNHGDRCEWFADELRADGYDASAPERNATVSV